MFEWGSKNNTLKLIMKKVFLAAFLGFGIMVSAQVTETNDEVIVTDEVAEVAEVEQEPVIYSTTSMVANSGFLQTVGFDGAWKLDMNLDNNKIILTGGTLLNKAEKESNSIRLMVYLAEKPFDLNNPEFIGTVYSVVDLESLDANAKESGRTYETSWASETKPSNGQYYPYILLGEENASTGQFEVKDVKAFEKAITIS